jgi:hypothetical protein
MSADEKKTTKKDEDVSDDKDTQGHNIFATQDYYFQRSREREAEVERELRRREREKEARNAKRGR